MSKVFAGLLLLSLLISGFEAAFAGSAHVGHGAGHVETTGGESADGEHSDHCCHIAGHLVGAVGEPGAPARAGRDALGGQLVTMRQSSRAPPPVPPPII